MIVVGVFLAPIALAALVALVVIREVLLAAMGLVASIRADPDLRSGCLIGFGVIGAIGLLYYLLASVFGIGGGVGWTAAAAIFLGALAVGALCFGIAVALRKGLRDPSARVGCAGLVVLGVAAAAFFVFDFNPSAWVMGLFDFTPSAWMMGLKEATTHWTHFARLAWSDFPTLSAVAGYGVLAAIVAAALRRDTEARLGCLIMLSAIAVAVPLALLLNGSLPLWLAIPIALIVTFVVAVVCLAIPSQTRVPLSAGVVVVGVLVAYLVGLLTAGPGEGVQGALGGALPDPVGEARIHGETDRQTRGCATPTADVGWRGEVTALEVQAQSAKAPMVWFPSKAAKFSSATPEAGRWAREGGV